MFDHLSMYNTSAKFVVELYPVVPKFSILYFETSGAL